MERQEWSIDKRREAMKREIIEKKYSRHEGESVDGGCQHTAHCITTHYSILTISNPIKRISDNIRLSGI